MRRPINTVNGYYKDPGKHWSAQDALNVLVRMAEKSGTRTVSRLVDAPGLRPFCRIGTNGGEEVGFTPSGAGRGMRVVDGRLFVVAGRTLWQITADGVSVPYGTIPGVGRVSMAHTQRGNGFELSIDNTQSRYVFNTLTQSLQKVTDESFPGSMRAFAIDGYTGYLEPQGLYWGHSDLANALNYIAFDTYEAEGQPDRIVSATVDNNRRVLIIGQQTTEIYVNQGSAQAPFVRASNTIIPYGSAARDSVQNFGSGTVLLDQNRVVRILSTGDDRISTSVIDSALQECTRQQIANAYSFTLEGDGFQIYYLTVPGKFTFGFDFVNREWHRRSSTDLDWWAVTDVVQWNGKWYALDSRVGEIFEVRWRDYPFDGQKELVREWVTGSISADQNPVYVHELELLFGCGGQAYTTVDFLGQPAGPSITGKAPDAILGEPYSFTYTTTPGDAPVARTILMAGSSPIADYGLTWDRSTATISGTPTKAGTITLIPRVIDTNELFDELTDALLIAEVNVLLVTSTNNLGDGIWSKSYSQEDPTFSGIPTSTGADIVGGVGAAHGNTFSVLTPSAGRFADSPLTEWSPSTRPTSGPLDGAIHQHAGGPAGWLATTINAGLYRADVVPDEYVAVPGSEINEDWGGVRMVRYTGGKYYLSIGGDLVVSEDLATYTLVYNRVGNDSIVEFNDICDVDGILYACVGWNASFVTRRYQLRRSNDGGATWPDLLIDQTDTPRPLQVESSGEVVVCLGGGGLLGNAKIWTSLDDFATPIDCGIMGINDSTISESYQYSNGLQIATGSGLFFILGQQTDSELAVTYNPETEELSEPYSNQTLDAIGIVAGSVE